MRSKFGMVVSIFAATMIFCLGAACGEISQEFIDDLALHVGETEAEQFTAEHGKAEWVPLLCSIVSDPAQALKKRAEITFYIGKYRAPEGVPCIISLIEEIRCAKMQEELKNTMLFAMGGLGFCGTDEAFLKLGEMSKSSYWKKPCQNSEPGDASASPETAFSTPDVIHHMREMAINCIGYSGVEGARKHLVELQKENEHVPESELPMLGAITGASVELESRIDGSNLLGRNSGLEQPSYSYETPAAKPAPRSGQPKKAE